MQLTPDYTIFIQVAIFIAVWLGLRAFAFQPTEQVLEERNRRTVLAHQDAEAMIAAAHADRTRYEEAVHQRRVQTARESDAARHVAAEESAGVIAATRAAVLQELTAHREAIAAQVAAARRTLAGESERIAGDMLQRVTGGGRT